MMQKQVTEVIFQTFSEEVAMESKQRLVGYEESSFKSFGEGLEETLLRPVIILRGLTRKMEETKACSGRTRGNVF